jgi:2-methylcitrate dehydratase PrpD
MPEGTRTPVVPAAAAVARFIHGLTFDALPGDVVGQAQRCLLDALGVAAAGSRTKVSAIARALSATQLCGREHEVRMLFDGRRCSAAGAAFAGGTTIDAVDAHDGHVLTKGHAGVAVVPGLLALCDRQAQPNASSGTSDELRVRATDGREFLTCLVVGYEVATRAGIALHASVADYHCSGAWNALGCAAVAARLLGFDVARTGEALGIAEYFGPRGQMLRACSHPSMVKDGSGWGAHVGITSAWLASEGFTGAPAVTVESDEQRPLWVDLGTRWRIDEQYFKPHPVCRWAQPAIEAVLALQRAHGFGASDIAHVGIATFREAVALGSARAIPQTTEDAQYSLPYPVAAALVFGRVGADEIAEPALADARVRTLLAAMTLEEDAEFSRRFPAERWARATIRLKDGRTLGSEPARARGGPDNPLSDDALRDKYFDLAAPVLGLLRARRIEQLVRGLEEGGSIVPLLDAVLQPA